MRVIRRLLPLAFLLPLGGCVFAVGGDGEGNEKLRDKVRDLEKRVDRLENGGTFSLMGRNRLIRLIQDSKDGEMEEGKEEGKEEDEKHEGKEKK